MDVIYLQLALVLMAGVSLSRQDRLDGGCEQDGVRVAEGDLIAQHDPCHVCQCRDGAIECFWKSCGAPPELCDVMQVENRCNPSLYVCPIPASVADVPVRAAQSIRTVTLQQPGPTKAEVITPPTTETATLPNRSRSRSNDRSTNRSRSRASSRSRSRSKSRASSRLNRGSQTRGRGGVMSKRTGSSDAASNHRRRGRLPTSTAAPVIPPPTAPVPVLAKRPPPPPARSLTRSNAVPQGLMKFVTQPRVRPQFLVNASTIPAVDLSEVEEFVTGGSVASGAYFNEELSVPRNFVMPDGRSPGLDEIDTQQVTDRRVSRKRQHPLNPSTQQKKPSRSRVRPTAEPPTAASTASSTSAPQPSSGRSRSRSRASRRRNFSPNKTRTKITKTSKLPNPTSARRRAGTPTPALKTVHTPQLPHLQGHHQDLGSMMFPEFGRRLRRDVAVDVFDAETVRRLEVEWRTRRRRRSLLPGDDNQVHHHGDHPRGNHSEASCTILGVQYQLGEVVGVASDNCLECRCAAQALFCSPKCCFFAIEERPLREGRRLQGERRPHPLQAHIAQAD